MKHEPLIRRVGFAVAGVRAAWADEPSFRLQVAIAVLVILALVVLRPAAPWLALAGLAAAGVLAAELFNSAVERLADALTPGAEPRLGTAKDLAAGGVLMAVVGAGWCAAFLAATLVERALG